MRIKKGNIRHWSNPRCKFPKSKRSKTSIDSNPNDESVISSSSSTLSSASGSTRVTRSASRLSRSLSNASVASTTVSDQQANIIAPAATLARMDSTSSTHSFLSAATCSSIIEEVNEELSKKDALLKKDKESDTKKSVREEELAAPTNNKEQNDAALPNGQSVKKFPDINDVPKKQNLKPKRYMKTIADYAVVKLEELPLGRNAKPISSKDMDIDHPPVLQSLKRPYENIKEEKEEAISQSTQKKFKYDEQVAHCSNSSPDSDNESHLHVSHLDFIHNKTDGKNYDDEAEAALICNEFEKNVGLCNSDESDENDQDDYDNEDDIHMPFPNLVDDINFDVNMMLRRNLPGHLKLNKLSEKAYKVYMEERRLTAECITHLYDSLKNVPNNSIERDPDGLRVHLMSHQRQALQWMKWRETQKPSGGILADDMGLGKTLQMIALVLAAKNERKAQERAEGKDVDTDIDDYEDWGYHTSREIFKGRTLVICPPSLLEQWDREIRSKCKRDRLSSYIYHGDSRLVSPKTLSLYDFVITTYNLLAQEYDLQVVPKSEKDSRIYKIDWERIILDEAHYIRNYKTKISVAACELRSKIRWALTGTPIQNKEEDFYALLKFLKCRPFDEIKIWKRWINNQSANGNKRLIVISKTIMLRRTKKELITRGITSLPQMSVEVIEVNLDKEEWVAYQKLLLYSSAFFSEFLRRRDEKEFEKKYGHKPSRTQKTIISQEIPSKMSRLLRILAETHTQFGQHYIMVLILRLRQMCCHPALIHSMLDKEDIELAGREAGDSDVKKINENMIGELNDLLIDDDSDDDDKENDGIENFKFDVVTARNVMSYSNPTFRNDRKSSKVRVILKIIQDIVDKSEKVVIVSQWTSFLRVIANFLSQMEDVNFAMFNGATKINERGAIVNRLNDVNDTLNVLLLSLAAGGIGLNLVGANHLMLIDLHWNPQLESQAQDRIYRFGQENPVHIYKIICKDTIEEKIKELQDKKLKVATNVLNGTVSNRLTIKDLKKLFALDLPVPEPRMRGHERAGQDSLNRVNRE